MKGIFVTGTDTDVGKTFVSKLIAKDLTQKGFSVAPRKPIESGCLNQDGKLVPQDAESLYKAANYKGLLDEVCKYRFEEAISPERAARINNQTVTLENIVEVCTSNINDNEILLVEGAGGFYSPLCSNGLNADLAQALNLPVVLVINNRLGCINHTLLTIEAIKHKNLKLVALVVNNTAADNSSEMDNIQDLSKYITQPIYACHHNQQSLPEEFINSLI